MTTPGKSTEPAERKYGNSKSEQVDVRGEVALQDSL